MAEAEGIGVESISRLSSAQAQYEKNSVLWKKKTAWMFQASTMIN